MKEGDVVEYKGSEWTIIGNSVDKNTKGNMDRVVPKIE